MLVPTYSQLLRLQRSPAVSRARRALDAWTVDHLASVEADCRRMAKKTKTRLPNPLLYRTGHIFGDRPVCDGCGRLFPQIAGSDGKPALILPVRRMRPVLNGRIVFEGTMKLCHDCVDN